MSSKIKISAVILTKDETENDLSSCINGIIDQDNVDEIIIVDSSNNSLAKEVLQKIDILSKYYNKKIGYDSNINGFDDLRNFGNSASKNDWVLHIDVDELISKKLFASIDSIIYDKDTKANAYSFPRINLPFYEQYPDYQTRLINKLNCEWINKVHEKVKIFNEPYEIKRLDNYPIIHKSKNTETKIQSNKRWKSISKKKNILICSLFKDSKSYISQFLSCLSETVDYSGHEIELCFIEGNSSDNTKAILSKYIKSLRSDIYCVHSTLNLPSINRFEALSILRNMLIKYGLKSHHDYVLMIDSDTIFDRMLLKQLITSIETNKCDVVAPMVFIKDFRDYKDGYFYDTLAFIDNHGTNFDHHHPYNKEENKDIIKMTSVGTCYLAKSEIFNINDFKDFNVVKCYKESQNKEPIIYDSLDTTTKEPISEQVSFFNKLKKYGYQVYVDTNIKIFHVNLEELGLKWH